MLVKPLGAAFTVRERLTEHLAIAAVGEHTFVWASLHHPTREWSWLSHPYLRDVVVPTLTRARTEALALALNGYTTGQVEGVRSGLQRRTRGRARPASQCRAAAGCAPATDATGKNRVSTEQSGPGVAPMPCLMHGLVRRTDARSIPTPARGARGAPRAPHVLP